MVDKQYRCQIIDYNLLLNYKMDSTDYNYNVGPVCDFPWRAPETLYRRQHNLTRTRTNSTDEEQAAVYSFGVILWELLTLQIPAQTFTEEELASNQKIEVPPPVIDHELAYGDKAFSGLIEECVQPSDRPTFDSLYTTLAGMTDDSMREEHMVLNSTDYHVKFQSLLPSPSVKSSSVKSTWNSTDEEGGVLVSSGKQQLGGRMF
jgi:hypothetical protein